MSFGAGPRRHQILSSQAPSLVYIVALGKVARDDRGHRFCCVNTKQEVATV